MNTKYYETALNTIYEISVILNSSSKVQESFWRVLTQMSDSLSMDIGCILLYDHHADELILESYIGFDNPSVKKLRYKVGKGAVSKALKLGIPVNIPDISKESFFLNKLEIELHENEISFMAVPIIHQGTTYGVLVVDQIVSNTLNSITDVDIFRMIATLMGAFLFKVNEAKQVAESEKIRVLQKVLEKNVVASSSTYSKDSNNCFDYASDSDLSEEEIQEREELVRALERSAWVQAKAARMLDMTVRQINYRIKKFNIVVKKL